jgi:predicted amidohydrolase
LRISAVQTKPIPGDIPSNIDSHLRLLYLAISHQADLVVFPELSLTGYEPTLAADLATAPNDNRFSCFQKASIASNITIGLGVPTKNAPHPCISMILFRPDGTRWVYSKRHLHPDEQRYFTSGDNLVGLTVKQTRIALAICYEISVPGHAAKTLANGATIYLASVAKTATGVQQASTTLSSTARTYGVPVLMANCVGPADGGFCRGTTSAWDDKGALTACLNTSDEGMVLLDTDTQQSTAITL